MELGSKITTLEEEIGVLKGEIKTILQEVRTAVLARENPFATDSYELAPLAIPATSLPHPTDQTANESETMPKVVKLQAVPEPERDTEETITEPIRDRYEAGTGRIQAENAASIAPGRRRWGVGALANLMSWTHDVTSRMDANDLDIVLSMARYGGLIEAELEVTLTKLAAPLFTQDQERRRSGVADYLLALRELSALVEDAEQGYAGPAWRDSLRRAS